MDNIIDQQKTLINALNNYANNATNRSIKRQILYSTELISMLKDYPDLPEVIIVKIVRLVATTVFSRFFIRQHAQIGFKVIEPLIQNYPLITLNSLAESLSHVFIFPKSNITKQMALSSALAAKWLLLAWKNVDSQQNENFFKNVVMSSFANLAFYSCKNAKVLRSLKKICAKLVHSMPSERISSFIRESNMDFRQTLAIIVAMPSRVFDNNLKAYFIDIYTKNVLMGKQKLPNFLLNSFSSLFADLNSDDFHLILTTIKKAMLRSPEIAVWGLESVLKFSKFDSSFAMEIYKLIIPCLMNTLEEIRKCWCGIVFYLVQNCNDDILLLILRTLFSTFNGEYGKLTNIVHKKSVLETIESLSEIKEECDEECDLINNEFGKIIKLEGFESINFFAWKVIATWSQKSSFLSPSLLSLVKDSLHSSTVRAGALKTLIYAFDKYNFIGFPKDLLKNVEKIWEANANPVEFICSSILLLKFSDSNEFKKTLFHSILKNHNFHSEKFIISISKSDAVPLLLLYECLVEVSHALKMEKKIDFAAFFMLLFWPEYSIRKMTEGYLKKVLHIGGPSFCKNFLNDLYEFISSGKIDEQFAKICQHNNESKTEEKNFVTGKYVLPTLEILLISKDTFDELKEMESQMVHIITSSLLICSLPRIVEYNGSMWIRWIKMNNITELLDENVIQSIIDRVFTVKNVKVKENAVKMILSAGDLTSYFRDSVWKKVSNLLEEIDLQRLLNLPEKNLLIFNTPDGVLCNVDVIEEKSDEAIEAKNLRRENKAYKFKEQILDIQLRRELAEKRRLEGKLTARQEMIVESELKLEKSIRLELNKLHDDCVNRLNILRFIVQADPCNVISNISLLYDIIIPLLRSKLVSKCVFETLCAFRDAAFPPSEDYLHELVLYSLVRVLEASYFVNEWCEIPLLKQLEKTISLLIDNCVVYDSSSPDLENLVISEEQLLTEIEEEEDVMNAIKFCFVFPFIKTVLLSSSQPYHLKTNVIRFLQSALNSSIIKDKEVPLLPLVELYKVLIELICGGMVDLTLLASSLACSLTKLIDECSIKTPDMINAIQIFLDRLFVADDIVRQNILKVLALPIDIYKYACKNECFTNFIASFRKKTFILRFDNHEECSKIAKCIWLDEFLDVNNLTCEELIEECATDEIFMHDCTSSALGDFISFFPQEVPSAIRILNELYTKFLKIQDPVRDDLGHVILDAQDNWKNRLGIMRCLSELSFHLSDMTIVPFIKILVPSGIDDHTDACRQIALSAAVNAIKEHGKSNKDELHLFLEGILNSLADGKQFDNLRQGIIILMGTLAQHIDPNDEKVRSVTSRLLQMLSTPSQQVQEAVSECLPPLIPSVKEDFKNIMMSLLCLLVEGETYGERRGAAYGIAAFVKGLGMGSLREFELMKGFSKHLSDKQNPKCREGALLAMEILCKMLGKLFEPYIVQILPPLLMSFGDSESMVRRAAEDTAREMMAMLSVHGVKLILPSLLKALDEDSWRTKCASVELLGAMSYCAPKQLSSCLPNIVPKLIEVLADSHAKVRAAGAKALKQIASVIRNPEILGISGHLLAGLIDPSEKTFYSLRMIVNTRFVHYMDAASLALIMPIINRAFVDRNSEARRMAAQIIASIYSLTASKDIEPYLSDLVPGLQETLLDPIPEIRAVAAKAFGALIYCSSTGPAMKMKDELMCWLKEKLYSTTSSVDRSGAAQGLAEIMRAIGTSELDAYMPTMLSNLKEGKSKPEIRDGCMLLCIYFPLAFEKEFMQYLPKVVPGILNALADENEYVRESALKAGQRLINMYSSEARQLLLPQLREALLDPNWRIRYAAVNLIGDFLFCISGISGKMTSSTLSDDDTVGTENIGKAIIKSLGNKCRDQVLSGIYLARSDTSLSVRQSANHVWKVVVANTPRTVKEIMKTLFEILLECLASNDEERQQIGAKCLGELVKKMGERIIVDVLPVLNSGISSFSVEQRQGISIALYEIVKNTTHDVVVMYSTQLLEPIKTALCDDEKSVRKLAATTFNAFNQNIGHSVFDIVIGPLISSPCDINESTLDGLTEVMLLNSRQMLPYILPKLTRPPINSHALSVLAAASGDSLNRNIDRILDTLLESCKQEEDLALCSKVILNVTNLQSVSIIITTLLKKSAMKHVESSYLLYLLVKNSQISLTDLVRQILSGTLMLYSSPIEKIVSNAIETLICLQRHLDAKEDLQALSTLKQTLVLLDKDSNKGVVPGLAHPKGLQPLLPIIRDFVLSANTDSRLVACEILATLVQMSAPSAIKAHVVAITGPLIRVFGERSTVQIKVPILMTLLALLDKIDTMLRAFLPQLQSTFLKTLTEPSSRNVRLLSGGGIARLTSIHPKPESVGIELVKILQNPEDKIISEAVMLCLRSFISRSYNGLSNQFLTDLVDVIESIIINDVDDATLIAAASLYGEVKLRLNALDSILLHELEKKDNLKRQLMAMIALEHICNGNAAEVLKAYSLAHLNPILITAMQSDQVLLGCSAVRTTALILMSMEDIDLPFLTALARAINNSSNDIKLVVASSLNHIGQKDLSIGAMKAIVPMMINGTKENNTAVRTSCERALISIFKLQRDNSVFEAYLSTTEGAIRNVLIAVHKVLQRSKQSADITSRQPLSNIPSVL